MRLAANLFWSAWISRAKDRVCGFLFSFKWLILRGQLLIFLVKVQVQLPGILVQGSII